MECHQDIARGFVKGDRVITDAHWSQLTDNLNSCSPPTKDCNGWKKTWSDWKVYVKKKLCHNKKENSKTGGGQYNKYILSDVEETVARVSGIHTSVEGIAGAKSFGEADLSVYFCESDKENDEDDLDVTPSTSNSAKQTENDWQRNRNLASSASKRRVSRTPSPTAKRNRTCTPHTQSKPDLNSLLAEENKYLKNLVEVIEEQRVDIKLQKILHIMEEQRDEMKIQNQKLDRLCNILEKHYQASELNDIETQKKIQEKYELKLKLIEIETLRLELDKQKAKLG